jgi:hypothetical protein
MKVTDNEGNEHKANEWIVDESTGEKVMYSRVQSIPICTDHVFDKKHECTKCPYMFTGFRANKHIQKADGIYDRSTDQKIV